MITITGKNLSRFENHKWEAAWSLMTTMYVFLSKTSNIFIRMSKEEEKEWELNIISDAMKHHTRKEIDDLIEYYRGLMYELK